MPRRSSQSSPWGYLLPMRDGLTPYELRLEKTVAGLDVKCSLQLNPAQMGLPETENTLFHLTRSDSRVVLKDDTRKLMLTVDGKPARMGRREHILSHGSRIGVQGHPEPFFIFVDRASCESYKAPQKLLDRYLVVSRLGEGGFGQVFLLFDKKSKLKKRLALKVVQLAEESDRKFAERERKILLNVKHPCIVSTYDELKEKTEQYFIMEFLPGGDLSQYVNERSKPMTEAQTKLIFFQLALAVQYLHGQNICHRDLKPANILLQKRDPHTLIKVTDFGLAKDEKMHSTMTTIAGTAIFLAPEVVTQKQYTNQVDVWSMGIILFFALSGTVPFPGGVTEAVRHQYSVMYPHERWQGVSMAALELVKRMLKVQATNRPSIAQVVDSSWLQDDKMREDVFTLTGLKEIRPSPKKTNEPQPSLRVPAVPKQRPLSGPRGVLEHWTHTPVSPVPPASPSPRFNYGAGIGPAARSPAAAANSPAKATVRHKEVTPPRVAGLAPRQQQLQQPPPPPLRNPANIGGALIRDPAVPPNGAPARRAYTPQPRPQLWTPRAGRTPPVNGAGAIPRLNSPSPNAAPANKARDQKTYLLTARDQLRHVPPQ